MEGLIKKTQASRSATRLDFHVVGHFVLHDFVGGAGVAVVLGDHLIELVLRHHQPAFEVIRGEDAAEEGTQQVSEFGETCREDGHV